MIPKFVGISFLIVVALSGCSQPATGNSPIDVAASDNIASLFDKRVSFVPPTGFRQLNPEEIKAKHWGDENLRYAFADTTGSQAVLIYVPNATLTPDKLIEIKGFVERTQKDYSGWITSEMINVNGREWFHFEWQKPELSDLAKLVALPDPDASPSPTPEPRDDRLFHYNEYTTSFDGKPLRFVFECLPDQFPKMKDAFAKSAGSIKVKE